MNEIKLQYLEAFSILENTALLYADRSDKSLEDVSLADFLRDVRAARAIAVFLTQNTK